MPKTEINKYEDIDQSRKVKMFAVVNQNGQMATVPEFEIEYDNYDKMTELGGICACVWQAKAPLWELFFWWCYADEDPHRSDVWSYKVSFGFQSKEA